MSEVLDLDNPERTRIPPYKLKIGGQERSYDAVVLAFAVRCLEGVEDPAEILVIVRREFKLEDDVELSAYDAMLILKDFETFTEKELEEPLKKVFGREPSSTTTSDSLPPKSAG